MSAPPSAEWTFLIYMESPGSEQDAMDEWLVQQLVSSTGRWPGLQVLYEMRDGDARLRGRILPGHLVQLARAPRVGSISRAITSFVDWASEAFPSRYTALFLRDHGAIPGEVVRVGGQRNWLIPRTPPRALLSAPDPKGVVAPRSPAPPKVKKASGTLNERGLRTAVSRTHRGRVDVYGFDACSMSIVEFAYEVRDVTSYVVAAESAISYAQFPYSAAIGAATASPAAGPLGVATAIADAASSLLAVTEVGWMDHLAKPLGGLGQYLLDTFQMQRVDAVTPIMDLRARCPSDVEFVDLRQLLEALRPFESDHHVAKLVAQARKYMSEACLSDGRMQFGASSAAGLGLVFPKLDTMAAMLGYGGLDFAHATAWGTFLFQYLQFVAFLTDPARAAPAKADPAKAPA
jgi:Clostripain family